MLIFVLVVVGIKVASRLISIAFTKIIQISGHCRPKCPLADVYGRLSDRKRHEVQSS